LIVAGVLGGVGWLLGGHRIWRWALPVVSSVAALLVLTDLVFYKFTFDHLRPSFFDRTATWNVGIAVSSLTHEMDWIFGLGASIGLAGVVVLVRVMLQAPQRLPPWQALGWGAALLFLAGLPALGSRGYFHLNEHVLIAAGRDWASGSLADSMGKPRLPATHIAKDEGSVDKSPVLAGLRSKATKLRNGRQPNVVLVVMESVGALNLLTGPKGGPSPVYSPNLARMAARGVLFDSIYAPAPATMRSHVSIHTGGRVLSQGGAHELEHRYQGSMLGRSMQNLGCTTGLFSSQYLHFEDMDDLLEQGGYDRFQDFDRDLANLDKEKSIHSWGAREEYTMWLADQWLEVQKKTGKPFFMEYLTVASHHPYGAPADYRAPFSGKDDLSQYLNSVHYTDGAIGYLMASLARKGLLQDTVFVITGDHGEAFGDRHKMNLVHKNFLYEENVRSFVLMFDPAWELKEPIQPARIGSNGDIMPTLLAYLGEPDATLAGSDLMAEVFHQRRVHFFKNAQPEQWGLRDGKWKFIAEIRSGRAELYDLSVDGLEQHNVAEQNPERVARYAAAAEDWFVRSEEEYTARLENFRPAGGRKVRLEEYRRAGPKLMSTGRRRDGRFTESLRMKSGERPTLWTHWVSGDHTQMARWQWISPTGKTWSSELVVQKEWSESYVSFPGALPMERGGWTVKMLEPSGSGLTSRLMVD
jgi:phosphoglycerol transferase MdoB-like AlkP superfamily enzyme